MCQAQPATPLPSPFLQEACPDLPARVNHSSQEGGITVLELQGPARPSSPLGDSGEEAQPLREQTAEDEAATQELNISTGSGAGSWPWRPTAPRQSSPPPFLGPGLPPRPKESAICPERHCQQSPFTQSIAVRAAAQGGEQQDFRLPPATYKDTRLKLGRMQQSLLGP